MTGHSPSTFEAIAAVRPIEIDRRGALLSYIKTETRWQLIAPRGSDPFNPDLYAERRAHFTRRFAAIRNDRYPVDGRAFYDAVAYQAAVFRYLIEARRQRARAS